MRPASRTQRDRRLVDATLRRFLPRPGSVPVTVRRAMAYSLFPGGKRLRPILAIAACRALGGRVADVLPAGAAIEMIHTYSLIHDDLPALDNDDLRRGRATSHRVFGEAMAILAGDALLTLAFRVLSTLPGSTPDVRSALVAELSDAAGTVDGMIGGQVADLEAVSNPPNAEMLEYIHRSKTAALFRAAVSMAAIAERAEPATLARLAKFGQTAGLAFQIADDILDVESSTEALGKTAGKDAAQKKATYPALYGVERSRQLASEWIAEAKAMLDPFGERASVLRELADRLVFRKT